MMMMMMMILTEPHMHSNRHISDDLVISVFALEIQSLSLMVQISTFV